MKQDRHHATIYNTENTKTKIFRPPGNVQVKHDLSIDRVHRWIFYSHKSDVLKEY